MLEFRDVTVQYGTNVILDQISFQVCSGRMTVLVGRNGCGKSTLLAALNQQIPYTGTICTGELDCASMDAKKRARSIAILPQTIPAPHLTAEEVVAFGRSPHLDFLGRMTEKDKLAVEQALRDADIEILRNRFVDTLSGGERQRVYLAMILAQDTPLICLDEPTAHMDQKHESAFFDLLTVLKEKGKSILVIVHDLSLAAHYADDLIVIDQSKVVFAGDREQCLQKKVLEKTFGVYRYCVSERGETRNFFSAY